MKQIVLHIRDKKYRSIKQDIAALAHQLENNPIIGDEIIKDCYKILMSIASNHKRNSVEAG